MARTLAGISRLGRRWAVRGVRRRLQPHGLVLMYHRVASSPLDPWRICVSPEHFEAHLQVLARLTDVVPLSQLPEEAGRGGRKRPAVSITFDDGYLDNLEQAAPMLAHVRMPATVFLATGWIGRDKPYWWDRLAWILLAPNHLPASLDLPLGERAIRWRNNDRHNAHQAAGNESDSTRTALHLQLWSDLRLRDEGTRDAALERLAAWSGADADVHIAGRPMNPLEVKQLQACGAIDIGAHTVSHAVLPELPAEQRRMEIRQSLDDCQRLTGKRPVTFAYPYGDLDQATVDMARDSGVRLACSTRADLLWPGADPHALPRVAVDDWPAAAFERWLRWYWLP